MTMVIYIKNHGSRVTPVVFFVCDCNVYAVVVRLGVALLPQI